MAKPKMAILSALAQKNKGESQLAALAHVVVWPEEHFSFFRFKIGLIFFILLTIAFL